MRHARPAEMNFPLARLLAANSERNFPRKAAILCVMSADGFSNGPPAGARADWTIDQDWAGYSNAEHEVWMTLYARQTALLPGRACDPFLKGLEALDLHRAGIPDFARKCLERRPPFCRNGK